MPRGCQAIPTPDPWGPVQPLPLSMLRPSQHTPNTQMGCLQHKSPKQPQQHGRLSELGA